MQGKIPILILICFAACIVLRTTGLEGLTDECYRCLCHVSTNCNTSYGCKEGYCGPFKIAKVYWIDAGRVVLPEDDPERNFAWKDCANNYYCAQRIVEGYLQNFVMDCNGDGLIDCYDYMMINFNGGYSCTIPLNETEFGRSWIERYEECHFQFEIKINIHYSI